MVLEEAAAGFLYSLKKHKRRLRFAACEARLLSWLSTSSGASEGGPLWSPQPCPLEGICGQAVALRLGASSSEGLVPGTSKRSRRRFPRRTRPIADCSDIGPSRLVDHVCFF